ncbi:hypothetical protein ACOMHN_048630 [Nucella lapillus]
MSCWTLWQRMPPRYQLTMRDVRTEDQGQDTPQGTGTPSRASSATPGHTLTIRTSRMTSSAGRQRRPGSSAQSYSPPRSSAYIHNMKNQMRINSARRKINEGTLVLNTPSTLSYTPKPRATTAPAFPITDPNNTDRYHRLTSPAHPHTSSNLDAGASSTYSPRQQQKQGPAQRPQRGFSGRKTPQRPSSGYGGKVGRRHVPVRTLCPFGGQASTEVTTAVSTGDELHTSLLHRRSPSPTYQDCVIGDYQVAALYVDKGRVTFFRKTKPDVTQSVYSAISPYNVTHEDGSYLAHLRKAYLSGVRDLPKLIRKDPDPEKNSTIQERMDYDRKVGRILDYYSKVDVTTGVQSPQPPEVHQTLVTSPFVPSDQRVFRASSYRRPPRVNAMTEVRDSNSHTISAEFPDQRGPIPSFTSSRALEQGRLSVCDGGGFVRINAKARLHHRHQFYLRTPGGYSQPLNSEAEQSPGCVCGMCRLEMEVALMAQLHQDLGGSVDAMTAAHIRSSLEKGALSIDPQQTTQSTTAAAGERDQCPARPKIESQRSADLFGAPVLVHPGMKPRTPASRHSAPGPDVSAATQTAAVTETTSLTVTLPAVEEGSDATHVMQGDEVAESSRSNDKATDPIQQTHEQNVEQETLNIVIDDESVKNSEQKISDTNTIEDFAKNPERTSDSPTGKDAMNAMNTPQQETPDTAIDRHLEKETAVIHTDDSSAKNSEQVITNHVEDSVQKSKQETSDTVTDDNFTKNSEQETSDTVTDDNSTKNSEQETSDTVTDDNSTKNSEQETSDTVTDDNSTKNLEQETTDTVTDENSTKNSEQETSGTANINESTAAEKPVTTEEENKPESMTGLPELDEN